MVPANAPCYTRHMLKNVTRLTNNYRLIVLTIDLGVLIATVLYFYWDVVIRQPIVTPNRMPPPLPHPTGLDLPIVLSLFVLTILILIALEWLTLRQPFQELSVSEGIAHIVARLVLVTVAIFWGRLPFTHYLLFPVVLLSYFVFGRKTAIFFAFVSFGIILQQLTLYQTQPQLTAPDLNNLLGFALGLVLVLLLANALQREVENNVVQQQLHSELTESHQQLQQYATQVATLAAADERNRLARDIHDSLGHHLAAISIQLEKANAYRERDAAKSAEALDHARRTIRDALSETRNSVSVLRQGETFDFISSLQGLIKRMTHYDLAIDLHLTGQPDAFSSFAQMTLYRTIQEGLTNVHKHASATEVTVSLAFSSEQATVHICDNGCGFEPNRLISHSHYGLQGIRERIALVGGNFTLESSTGNGVCLYVSIPRNGKVDR